MLPQGGAETIPGEPSTELLALLLDNTDASFILLNADRKVILFNRKAFQLVQKHLNKELYNGFPFMDAVDSDRKLLVGKVLDLAFQGKGQELEMPAFHKQDKSLYISNSYKPILDDRKVVVAVLITSTDVTKAKLAEEALKESEERWRFALEGSNHGLWDWNIPSGSVYFSNSFKQLHGFTEEQGDTDYHDWEQRVHPMDLEVVRGRISEHLESNNPYYESVFRMQGGISSYRWILARGMIIEKDETGAPLRMIGTHTDITAQKDAEESYKLLFYDHPIPMWTYDPETLLITEVNDATVKLYGYTRPEFLKLTLVDLLRPEDVPILYNILEEFERTKVASHQIRHRKKSGEIFFVQVTRSVVKLEGRELRLVSINDITKQVEANEDLKKSNERFHFAAKATSDAVYDWNLQTNDLFWGEGLTTLFSYRSEEVSIATWENLIHPDDRLRVSKGLFCLITDTRKKFWKEQYRFCKKDGTYAHVIDKGFIIRDLNGEAVRMIGAMQDITEIKQSEIALSVSNERYKFASLATSDVIWDWDLSTETVVCSETFTKLLGWQLPEGNLLPVATAFNYIHTEDRENALSLLKASSDDQSCSNFALVVRCYRSDNAIAVVSCKGYISRDASGKAIRVIGALSDITDKKYTSDLLELERKTLEKSTDRETPLKEVVDTLLGGLEELHPGLMASVLLQKKDGTIQHLSAPSLPDSFTSALNGIQMGAGDGSCGAAMYWKKMVITESIETDPLFANYRSLASSFNISAAWSVPIIDSEGTVMGSFAIYHPVARKPNESELNSIERAKNLLRILLENHISLSRLQTANDRFDSVLRATHDLIWDWELETDAFYRDKEGMQKVLGVYDERAIHSFHSWLARIHSEDQEKVQRVINKILTSSDQDIFELEYRFKRDDNRYNYVYDRGIILRDTTGKPVRMIGAAQDITLRKELEQQLVQRELEKQKLIGQATIETQEQERSEIGKELHDNVNQVLTTTKLYLDLSLSNPEMKDELIQKSTKNVIYVINEIRQLSRSLMNPSLGDLGLLDSIHDLIENINLTRKLHVVLTAPKDLEGLLDEQRKLTIFRIVQEALNNAIKHAKATTVQVKLKNDATSLSLNICDDGLGFDPASVIKGSGLKNIQNRVYLSDASFAIRSKPGKGCKIEIKFPLTSIKTT
ncbi:MAG TPA: PAS domain-containing protein [Flavisolibacter sp.]|nr:PAS domain-containing protein [Flavisolibacter sp.]